MEPYEGTSTHYANEKHTLILIALMKAHGIRKIIASPGSTNAAFVASLQCDSFFEMFSAVDERSAAYMAVGLAAESNEPVAITCTGSTASRDYIPGLTEAFYRKLPVLAITASQHFGRVGQYRAQVIDRSAQMADMVMESVDVNCIYTEEDKKACISNINKALIALKKNGGGPSHINLVTTYSRDYSVKALPDVRKINYVSLKREMPSLKKYNHIAILSGVHCKWSGELLKAVEEFCQKYNAVVFTSHASNYKGEFGLNLNLIRSMANYIPKTPSADLVIYIGSIARYLPDKLGNEMWRVNPDGEIRDVEYKLTHVFAMDELEFFEHYNSVFDGRPVQEYAKQWQNEHNEILNSVPDLPFSNVWIAKTMSPILPEGVVFHISGANTARSWNFFPIHKSIDCYSNDGVMGIDGQMSSLLGESLAAPGRLHFGAVGDLTFFYDMNCLGNRHVRNNIRLLVVNNGKGTEFKIYTSQPGATLGDRTDSFIAAEGHFGNKSPDLIRHYAEDLGFEYLTASSKEEVLAVLDRFTTPKITEKSMIFEVFTDSVKENEAVYIMNHLVTNVKGRTKSVARDIIRSLAGEKGIDAVKSIIKK